LVPSGYLVAFEEVREELGIVRRRRIDPPAPGWVFDLFPATKSKHTGFGLELVKTSSIVK
jgi:hypothetical protein